MRGLRSWLMLGTIAGMCAGASAQASPAPAARMGLSDGWEVASSARVTASGAALSQPGTNISGWIPATVPTTVFHALAARKLVPDPDYGMNLRQAAGETYPPGVNFSNLPMPADSPYAVPWWFRTEFSPPAAWRGRTLWLDLDGINYRADIWMNGQRIAASGAVAGAFRRYEFDVSAVARAGAANALAIEVYAPRPQDLAITFVDWNPMPPDKDMGLWGPVTLLASGPVAIRHPFVATALDYDASGPEAEIAPRVIRAHLTVTADLVNSAAHAVTGVLRGAIGARRFARRITLPAGARQTVTFTPDAVAALNLDDPQLWWPYPMGTPHLETLQLAFLIAGAASDSSLTHFGISAISSELTPQNGRLFRVNGRRVLIRGGGWTPNMMLTDGPQRWAEDFAYVRAMNLNTVRLEGKLAGDAFFDLADRMGILVMAGWCCCDHWEQWGDWNDDERAIATASLRDQALRLRAHPSVLVWLNGSDHPPAPPIERAYLDVLHAARWPKPILSSASQKATPVTGISGVKMTGPYDYVPPDYWLEDTQRGGALGFNTETSPGAAIPPLDSLRLFLPPGHLWPQDEFWSFHAGGTAFANLGRFNQALAARYGAPGDLTDYVWKAQAAAYEGERAMFEAFGRNKYAATGVIQWMLNNAWPSVIWHLYDFYLRPGAGFFATRLACEPLHVQYADADRTVAVVNGTLTRYRGLQVTAEEFGLNGQPLATRTAAIDAPPDATTAVFALTPPRAATYFLRLRLRNGGRVVSSNFYWLSTRADVLDDARSLSYITPESSYADLTGLQSLPPAQVRSRMTVAPPHDGNITARVEISNPSSAIAFFLRLSLRDAAGNEILPVYWSDNYISLLPGETRVLTATVAAGSAGPLQLRVAGWNVGRSHAAAPAGP